MREADHALIELSAAIGADSAEAWQRAVERAAGVAAAAEVEEALLQSHLFAGYPATLRAFALWRARVPDGAAVSEAEPAAAWAARGERVCSAVYGEQYEPLRQNVRRLHPDLERWMVEDGYGKVLGRPGLELRMRELCIVALLAGRDARDPLYSHLRGALNAGATAEEVEVALAASAAVADAERALAARALWQMAKERARD